MTRIAFVFPYRGVGGVSNQFFNLASFLSQSDPTLEITIVDYKDGGMGSKYAENRIENLAFFEYKDDSTLHLESDYVVYQAMTPWTIFTGVYFNDDAKVIFWCCHPYNFIPSYPFIGRLKSNLEIYKTISSAIYFLFNRRLKHFVENLIRYNSIISIDHDSYRDSFKFLDVDKVSIPLVPVPIALDFVPIKNESNKVYDFCWVGRIEDFKIPIIKRFLTDLNDYLDYEAKIVFLGGGAKLTEMVQFAASLPHISAEFLGMVNPAEIKEILNESRICAAMGTSAVEAARMGVPTVLLDFSYSDDNLVGYKYKWFHEREGYSVGSAVKSPYSVTGKKMSEMLSEYHNNAEILSKDGVKSAAFHDLKSVAQSFLGQLHAAGVRWKDLSSFFDKSIALLRRTIKHMKWRPTQ